MEGPEERVLHDVVGVVGAHDPHGEAAHDRAVTVHQALERVELALKRLLNEREIGVHQSGRPYTGGLEARPDHWD